MLLGGLIVTVVSGLCSELLMRLSYYIHLSYGKKNSSHIRIELGPWRLEMLALPNAPPSQPNAVKSSDGKATGA